MARIHVNVLLQSITCKEAFMDLLIAWGPFAGVLLYLWAGIAYIVAGLRAPREEKSRRSIFLQRGLSQIVFIFLLGINLQNAPSGVLFYVVVHLLLAVEVLTLAQIITGRAREPGYTHPINLLFFRSPAAPGAAASRQTTILTGALVAVLALVSILGITAQPCGWLDRALQYSGCIRTIGDDHLDLEDLVFSPDGAVLASGEKDAVYLWRVEDGSQVGQLNHPGWGPAIAFSPDGALLASGGSDKSVRLWRVADRTLIHTFPQPEWVQSVVFSPDGALLAAGSYGAISVWNVSDGTVVRSWNLNGSSASLAFASGGQILVVEDTKGVQLWNVVEGSLIRRVDIPSASIKNLALSRDGKMIAGLDYDGYVWLVRLADGQVLYKLAIASEKDILLVSKVAFSPDGAIVAATANDALVWLWRVEDGRAIGTLKQGSSTGGVRGLTFGPEPTLLAAGSNYGAIRLWRIRT
jgi:hypothetical protein